VRIALIYLPKPHLKQPDAQAPLGLLYLAAALKQDARHEVSVHDLASMTADDAISSLPSCDAYGITSTSMELPQAGRFAARIKERFPGAWTLLGGPGACVPDLVPSSHIDTVVVGEADYSLPELLSSQTRPGLLYSRPYTDLDALPFPARDLLEHQGGDVFLRGENYIGTGSTVILSSRGCPFSCAFCAVKTMGLPLRLRSPHSVADEIRHVMKRYGIMQFRFNDDIINISTRRVRELCDAIGELGAAWRISCRVNPLDDEILGALRDAGCRELSFGIESFDDVVLQGLRKRASAVQNELALELAFRHDFVTRVLLMIRTPYQRPETIKLNKAAVSRLPFGVVSCKGFVPFPGTEIWNRPESHGVEIISRDLDDYNFYCFGPDGRRPLPPIIRQIGRPLDEFQAESEEFLDWLEEEGYAHRG
jgi:radical SAM superfamily enzyme YgiQ (UPF0313 family)